MSRVLNGYYPVKTAFTLAEVLITLGIIGTVAAITLPMLISNYQKIVLKSQYKKQLSVLNQAYQKAVFDYGTQSDCYFGGRATSCSEIFDYFINNLKVVKKCNSSFDEGCTAKYKGADEISKDNGASDDNIEYIQNGIPNFCKSGINSRNAYVLADGTVIITYFSNSMRPSLIDINGKKGPNKWGYDIRGIDPIGDSYKSQLGCADWAIEKGGISCGQMHE